MHPSVMAWVGEVLPAKLVAGKSILEVGSFDVNGTVRPLLAPYACCYVGVDMDSAPSVDVVADVNELCDHVGHAKWDVVVSTEMLEHVTDWRQAMIQMVDALKPDGLLCVTTRSPGFPYHAFPQDNWRYTKPVMAVICEALGLEVHILEDDPEAPGIFLLASKLAKPRKLFLGALDMITVAGVECV